MPQAWYGEVVTKEIFFHLFYIEFNLKPSKEAENVKYHGIFCLKSLLPSESGTITQPGSMPLPTCLVSTDPGPAEISDPITLLIYHAHLDYSHNPPTTLTVLWNNQKRKKALKSKGLKDFSITASTLSLKDMYT